MAETPVDCPGPEQPGGNRADRLQDGRSLDATAVPVSWLRALHQFSRGVHVLQQLGELVGVSTGLAIDPYQPVLYNAPTYNQFPYAVQRPQPPQTPRDMVPIIDQAVAHVNAFVVGFNRFLPYAPQVAGLQTRARSLRLSLMQLRQEVTTGGNSQMLQSRLGEVNQLLQTLTANWQQTVNAARLTNVPDLSEVTLAVQRVNQLYRSVYALN